MDTVYYRGKRYQFNKLTGQFFIAHQYCGSVDYSPFTHCFNACDHNGNIVGSISKKDTSARSIQQMTGWAIKHIHNGIAINK